MGRRRLNEDEKKVNLNLSIKKKYVDALRKKNINMSQLVENFIKKFLGM